MDKRERARAALVYFLLVTFFAQSTSSCIAAANIYHTEVFIAMDVGCLQRASAVAIFAAIHFLFTESISILDPN
jgi:hypothetical protein